MKILHKPEGEKMQKTVSLASLAHISIVSTDMRYIKGTVQRFQYK